jgi:hypothetical protein
MHMCEECESLAIITICMHTNSLHSCGAAIVVVVVVAVHKRGAKNTRMNELDEMWHIIIT